MLLMSIATSERSEAQTVDDRKGRINGAIHLMTPGVVLGKITVQLIIVGDDADLRSIETQARPDGRFYFDVIADPAVTHVVRVVYDGVQYLSNPVLISPELPIAAVELEIFAVSEDKPALVIEKTIVTVLAIDRLTTELTLIREDLVRHDAPTVYVGSNDSATLVLPAPDGTSDAGGFDEDTSIYSFDGRSLAITTALHPGVTSIVTRYTVGYRLDEDEYRLRITAPLRSNHIEVRVPKRFVNEVHSRSIDAIRAPDTTFEGESLSVIKRTTVAEPGQGLVVDLRGLSGIERTANPLTSRYGAAAGAVFALIVITGIAIGLRRCLPEKSAW